MDQSLYSRLHAWVTDTLPDKWAPNVIPIRTLEKQYRMDPEICLWPSKYFLGNSLLTGSGVEGNNLSPIYAYRSDSFFCFIFIFDSVNLLFCIIYRMYDVSDSCLNISDSEASDFYNQTEAEVVVNLVVSLLNSKDTEGKHIAVITFFEHQRYHICRTLDKRYLFIFSIHFIVVILIFLTIIYRLKNALNSVSVNLAEGFQGTEKDIVIVSCVLGMKNVAARDPQLFKVLPRMMPSLLAKVTKRLLIATTRSIETLIICGHLETLKENEMFRDLIKDAEDRQIIRRVSSAMHPSLLHDVALKLMEDRLIAEVKDKLKVEH